MRQRRDPVLWSITEVQWQATIVEHLERAGYLVFFVPDKMWRRAFVSHIPLDLGKRGYPDITAVGHGRVFWRELKKMGGKLSEHQELWKAELLRAGADYDVWYPSDLDRAIADIWREL